MRINVSQSSSTDSIRPAIAGMVQQLDLLVTRIGIFRRFAGARGPTGLAARLQRTRPNCNQGNDARHGTVRKANPQKHCLNRSGLYYTLPCPRQKSSRHVFRVHVAPEAVQLLKNRNARLCLRLDPTARTAHVDLPATCSKRSQGVNRRRKWQPTRNFDSVRRTVDTAPADGVPGSRMPPQPSTSTGRQWLTRAAT